MVDFKKIGNKWQKIWKEKKLWEAEPDYLKPKFMITFPYPYINGLPHLGHTFTSSRVEFYARYKRMKGFNVLWAQGWHATGGPIVSAALRVKEKDPKIIRDLTKFYKIPENEVDRFSDPKEWVKYFTKKWREAFEKIGFSIDWRRNFHTTYLNPAYSKFVEWQYNKLREKRLIVKGKHPVVWCPKEKKVVGDHDRPDIYAGITPEEIILIKFDSDIGKFVIATLRPETIYGATNIWINPKEKYVRVKVNGEIWVVSKESVEELKDLGKEIEILEEIDGEKLIGKKVKNPVGGEIPVLPAEFVNVKAGTGVVMSVPASAPYDWIALKELKEKGFELAKNIEPISIIESKWGDFAAIEVCKQMGIENQGDERLEKATKEVYNEEFYNGKLKKIYGKWAGKKVWEVKDEITNEFIEKGFAEKSYTLLREVKCRCGARCHVKIVEQWFLKYSDENWKKKAHECVNQMKGIPWEIKEVMHRYIDWFKDWACTHKEELGTPLPWDKEWVIESLSDSTIYMAYYTIAKYLQNPNKYGIKIEKIDDSFFDYIFLGKGNPKELAKKFEISEELLKEIRKEFLYWYPMNLRATGKDLIQNHIIFMIFHHVAIFPEELWPRGVVINGWVLLNGQKMSKSLGNVITLPDALERWGPDLVRFGEAYAGNSGQDDANIDIKFIESAKKRLEEWYNFAIKNYNKGVDEYKEKDKWFESILNKKLIEIEDEINKLNFKNVVDLWFDLQNAFKRYSKKGEPNKDVLNRYIEVMTKILTPITPHLCEEIWEKLGKNELISVSSWPEIEYNKINEEIEKMEKILMNIENDIREILKVVKKEPKTIKLIFASDWKYDLIKLGFEKAMKEAGKKGFADVFKKAREIKLWDKKEMEYIEKNKNYLEKVFNCKIEIEKEEKSKEKKARYALPGKPAILVF